MRDLCTVEQFATTVKALQRREGPAVTTLSLGMPQFGESGRTVQYVFSTPAVGRDLHTVAADAWQLDNFVRNPVFLWAHDDSLPPIGRVIDIGNVDGALKGTVEYADRELNPFADTIYQLVRAGYLNATSTSWQPIEWRFSRDKDRPGGIDFLQVDLLEISQVPIPALPTALAEARSRGIDTGPLYQWAERVLDSGGLVLVPVDEIESLRRAAKMPTPKRVSHPGSKKTAPDTSAAREDSQQAGGSGTGSETARAALQTKHARALAEAPAAPVFSRGLHDVAQLACLLQQLGYAHESLEYEAALEGDDSPVPGMLGEGMMKCGEALIAMTAEEVGELLARLQQAEEPDSSDELETRSLSAEDRTFIAAAPTARARAWRRAIAIVRAGKVLSASNEKRLREAHGHHERALKHHRAQAEHHEAVSGRMDELRELHERATSSMAELGYDHHQVTRAMDAMADKMDDITDRHEDVGDAHHAMGRAITAAHRAVGTVLDGAIRAADDENDEDEDEDEDEGGEDKGAKERAARLRRLKAIQIGGSSAA